MNVLINQSYAPQRVTGQQRYAREIADRLASTSSFDGLRPEGLWASSTLWVWAWVQCVLPLLARGTTVLSLTSRAPFWRRRHVLVVHDLFVLTNPRWFSRRYVWTHAPLLRAQIRSAAAVVAVSGPTADALRPLRHDTVEVAPNAPSEVFRDRPDLPDDHALRRLGVQAGSYFLAVGSRDPRKNLARLARAYGLLDEEERRRSPLVVVGAAASIYRSEELVWPEGTIDAGYVTDDDLRQLYRHSRAVVLVSLAEGFGLPLVEAAAAGARSLLVSDLPIFHWICAGAARYVDPLSSDDIAAGLRLEVAKPHEEEVNLERFDWDASAAVVREVCGRVHRAGRA
ncbi:glycosyltransferase family 4 protein [Actinomycetospora rhizophila]|uniref:Glycosyltransferase family 4 protein n=1 Tax=Actinomycetospora rhizophila TaxID=1416876 RepID=A0ABV9ZLP1_9PSEU